MAIYKKKFKPDLLLGAVVTDYTVHKWWLCEGVDVYFAASENLRAQFDGIDAGQITVESFNYALHR